MEVKTKTLFDFKTGEKFRVNESEIEYYIKLKGWVENMPTTKKKKKKTMLDEDSK